MVGEVLIGFLSLFISVRKVGETYDTYAID
nr:MAG TPA: hypothetical protein [Caudoviricetes sp.]